MKTTWLLAFLCVAYVARGQNRPSTTAHAQAVAEFQQQLNHEFSDPAESPLAATERLTFKSLPFYPVAYQYCVVARLVRDTAAVLPFAMPTSSGQLQQYRKYGELQFALNGQPQRLAIYQSLALLQKPGFADYLFVPFTDLTNGHGSYSDGRSLDLRIPPAGTTTLLLDFNRAYNPSCAYSPGYSCPIPPPENRLAIGIPAGVRSDH